MQRRKEKMEARQQAEGAALFIQHRWKVVKAKKAARSIHNQGSIALH